MADVRQKLGGLAGDYNHHRPHGSLGHLTPSEFATMRSGQSKEAARLRFQTVRISRECQNLHASSSRLFGFRGNVTTDTPWTPMHMEKSA